MRTILSPRMLAALFCLLIILAGAGMRLAGTNWDEGANLHPDERHMMFVVTDTMTAFDAPEAQALSWDKLWFDTGVSPLDPRRNGRLYVYGELPHITVSLLARATHMTGWPEALWLGRTLSAIIDSYTILAVFILATLIAGRLPAALGAAAFYAFTPLAIQQANFFTVDVWLTAASAWFLLATTLFVRTPGRRCAIVLVAVSGGLVGLAMACKVPGVFLSLVLIAAIVVRFRLQPAPRRKLSMLVHLGTAAFVAFITFRLASPFTFQGPGFFGIIPSPSFLAGYLDMTRIGIDPNFPPNWQWITGYGPFNALQDLLLWAIGPATTAALLAGLVAIVSSQRQSWPTLLPLVLTVLAFSLYWLSGPAAALRYMLPTIPALCVLAAFAFSAASLSRFSKVLLVVMVLASAVWGSGMYRLHTDTNSRVAASRWLWLNSPTGTVLANESGWDDGLPVPVRLPQGPDLVWPDQRDQFTSLRLNIDYEDTLEKAASIAHLLDQTDFLILSSERMRKPMLALASRFPLTTRYYGMLASGQLCFQPVYRQHSAYPVLGFWLDDSMVQEIWSVYDHPTVEIYRKQACYDPRRVEAELLQGLDSGS